MKKNILLLVMTFLAVMTTHVQADEWYIEELCGNEDTCCINRSNFYAKVFGGPNYLQNTKVTRNKSQYNLGYVVAGSLGYRWCSGLRFEGEYAYRRNNIKRIDFFTEGFSKKGHIQMSSYMANLLWDLDGCECDVRPFVGFGIGYDIQQAHATNCRVIFNQKWRHFSWQAMAGLTFPIFCNSEITLEYKFHQGRSHFYNHAAGIGFVYHFGL